MSLAAPLLRGDLRIREPMARHVSWRAGGLAERFYQPVDADDVASFVARLPTDEPLLWLGLGSNLLVRDGGFPGTVIALNAVLDGISDTADATLRVECGVHCARLAKHCAERQMPAAVFFGGIPGTVGGALAMNAGAWGGETWRHVLRVDVLYRDGRRETLSADHFRTGYRHAQGPEPDLCFLAAEFRFGIDPQRDAAAEIRQMLTERRARQPVGQPSCGSVFRNPEGDHAARLIEAAGLKGHRIGEAVISEKHANFILNEGAATAADIESLLLHAQRVVQQRFGVLLQPEVRIVGDALPQVKA